MKKTNFQANVPAAGAEAQQSQNGAVGSENTNIKVELTEKYSSSAIVNDDLTNRIAESFKIELDNLVEGDFKFTGPDEIRHFVKAVHDHKFEACRFCRYLEELTSSFSALRINCIVTLNTPCCGIKQVFIFLWSYAIITEGCYDQFEGVLFTDKTCPFVSGEESNLYKINNKMFRSIFIHDFAEIICEALVIDKDPVKLAEWIKDFKRVGFNSQ